MSNTIKSKNKFIYDIYAHAGEDGRVPVDYTFSFKQARRILNQVKRSDCYYNKYSPPSIGRVPKQVWIAAMNADEASMPNYPEDQEMFRRMRESNRRYKRRLMKKHLAKMRHRNKKTKQSKN